MSRATFQLRIRGPKPDQVSVRYLAEVLVRLEESVLSIAASGVLPLPSDGPALSLIDVDESSPADLLTLSADSSVIPLIAQISGAIAAGDLTSLPRPAHFELWKMSERVVGAGWGLEFVGDARTGIPPAFITPEAPIAEPPKPVSVVGTTTLLARCLRVGGATTPKAELRLAQGGKLLHVSVSEKIAKLLGRSLYEEVILRGRAEWDAETRALIDFVIYEVSEFNRAAPSAVMRELAESGASEAWGGVDALEFVARERGNC